MSPGNYRVPLEREELGMGRGYRLRHRFDHRIELVVAQFAAFAEAWHYVDLPNF